jgi:hypothetical protein
MARLDGWEVEGKGGKEWWCGSVEKEARHEEISNHECRSGVNR